MNRQPSYRKSFQHQKGDNKEHERLIQNNDSGPKYEILDNQLKCDQDEKTSPQLQKGFPNKSFLPGFPKEKEIQIYDEDPNF